MNNFVIGENEKIEIITELIKLFEKNYVFPDVSQKINKELNNQLNNNSFNEIFDIREFCLRLTEILVSISKDKHIKVVFSAETTEQKTKDTEEELKCFIQTAKDTNFGFVKIERLSGNIGYLDIREFYSPQLAGETAASAMKFIENTDAFIIDLRNNGGGDPEMVSFLCSYFFTGETVHLNSLYWRPEDRTQQFWTMPYVPGKRYIDKPIYILTSKRTFSAGEEFSYDLKALNRAIVVGEVTGGGANPGSKLELPYNCYVFVPMGTAINPTTNDNWEGKGVFPDIETSEDQAFLMAYEDALSKVIGKLEGNNEKKIQEAKEVLASIRVKSYCK